MVSGSNDKYQLAMNHEQRGLKLFSFRSIHNCFKKYEIGGPIRFKSISCWNLNAAIDESDRVFFWGLLFDKKVKKSLCIKVPEVINDFKVSQVALGATMALLIEKESHRSFVIGVNAKGELGLGDKKQRKTLESLGELRDKELNYAAIGRSGFVVALSRTVIHPNSGVVSPENYTQTMENTHHRMTASCDIDRADNESRYLEHNMPPSE